MLEEFRADIQQINPELAIIHLVGDVTARARKPIFTAYEHLLAAGVNHIIFNLRENDYIDSSGLSIFMGLATDAQTSKPRLGIVIPSVNYQKIFRMVGLHHTIQIYESLAQALPE